ncbi:MAG: PAS domain-containing protein, partial [Haloarculaceae archaeon]
MTPDGNSTYLNPALERITASEREEVSGGRPSILKSGVNGDEVRSKLWETILSGEVWRSRVGNERADGERYVVAQTIAPVMGDEDIRVFVATNAEIGAFEGRPDGASAKREVRQLHRWPPVPMMSPKADTRIIQNANRPAATLYERPRGDLEGLHEADRHPEGRICRELFREHTSEALGREGGRSTKVHLPD